MYGEQQFTLTLYEEEREVIVDLMQEIKHCGYAMDGCDYKEILLAIVEKRDKADLAFAFNIQYH